MIAAPTRRLWLYPTSDVALEILVLGDEESVAGMYARIRSLAERWPGFDRVSAIAQGGAVLGVRVTLSIQAHHADPIAEAMRALRHNGMAPALTWIGTMDPSAHGMVATW